MENLVNLLYCEFLKLKRSKMFLISVLGAMVAPIMVFAGLVKAKITEPDKILSNLHALVFKSLQQEKGDEYSQDGMDISLCVIDHKKNVLHFSAARNNAFLIDVNKNIRILNHNSLNR